MRISTAGGYVNFINDYCNLFLTGESKKMNLVEAIRSALDITLQTDPTAGGCLLPPYS